MPRRLPVDFNVTLAELEKAIEKFVAENKTTQNDQLVVSERDVELPSRSPRKPSEPPQSPPVGKEATGLGPYGEVYQFQYIRNTGGPRGIDCGLIALKDAAKAKGIEWFLAETPEKIREDMVRFFTEFDGTAEQCNNVALSILDERVPNNVKFNLTTKEAKQRAVYALRNDILSWEFLVMYTKARFPEVTLQLWNQVKDSQQFRYAIRAEFYGDYPILHIARWNRKHFEAFVPDDAELLDCILKTAPN